MPDDDDLAGQLALEVDIEAVVAAFCMSCGYHSSALSAAAEIGAVALAQNRQQRIGWTGKDSRSSAAARPAAGAPCSGIRSCRRTAAPGSPPFRSPGNRRQIDIHFVRRRNAHNRSANRRLVVDADRPCRRGAASANFCGSHMPGWLLLVILPLAVPFIEVVADDGGRRGGHLRRIRRHLRNRARKDPGLARSCAPDRRWPIRIHCGGRDSR